MAVILSINDIIKFLENMKQGFKRKAAWDKYKSEITTQLRNNNLDYMVDPISGNIYMLLVILFKNGGINAMRYPFDKYYMTLAKIKILNILIYNKPFFYQPVENKQEGFKDLVKISRNGDYTTGDLLDYPYHRNYYKFISIHLSRQANKNIPQ